MSAMDFAFASKVGTVSYVYRAKVRADDTYFVTRVKDISPAGVTPLIEVETAIRQTLIREKQEQLALEAAKKFRARVRAADDFLATATRESLKVDTTADHLQRDFIKTVGSDENFGKLMFTLNPGQISEAVSNQRGAYVAVLLNKSTADSAGFAAKTKELSDRLRQTKQNNVYTDWLANAKAEIGVLDNRHLYYTDY
jgi:parvulin-like peptidyl-prolyl isomerase